MTQFEYEIYKEVCNEVYGKVPEDIERTIKSVHFRRILWNPKKKRQFNMSEQIMEDHRKGIHINDIKFK